jgi:hypothetical protein
MEMVNDVLLARTIVFINVICCMLCNLMVNALACIVIKIRFGDVTVNLTIREP